MLSVAMVAIVMLPLFVYYQTSVVQGPGYRCPSGELPPCIGNDPYQILWNGTAPGITPVGYFASYTITCNGARDCSVGVPVNKGDFLGLYSLVANAGVFAHMSIFDSQGNTFVCLETDQGATHCQDGGRDVEGYFVAGSSGTDTVHVEACGIGAGCTDGGATWTGAAKIDRFGSATVGNTNAQLNTVSGTGTDSISVTLQTTSSQVWEPVFFIGINFVQSPCGTITAASSQTTASSVACDSNGNVADGFYKAFTSTGLQSLGATYNCHVNNSPFTCSLGHSVVELKLSPNPCPPGYACVQSQGTSLGDLELKSNGTQSGVMLTTTAINMATTASKELLFYENWESSTIVNNGKGWGWYLTTNATLPTQLNYNPLNDPNVVVVDVRYPTDNIYTYLQRNPGLSLLTASGLGENPGSTNCPQTATIFICDALNAGLGGTGSSLALVLNFTGGSTANANGSSNGFSGQCNGSGSDFTSFCSNFSGYPASPCLASAFLNCTTITFPWFNVQGGSYYLGFWADAAQTGTVDFHARQSGTFSQKANGIYYWVPNTATTNGNPDAGGFFGWLSRTTGIQTLVDGATWVAGQAVSFGSGVINSAQNVVFGPIMDGIQKALKWLINSLILFLNFVGGLFGFPTLGTALFNFFSDLVTTMIQLLLKLATWIVNTGGFVFNTLAFVVILALDTVVLATFTAWSGITSLLNILLNVVDIFFSYGVSISFLLLIDWLWGVTVCWTDGVQGVLAWIDVNLNIFTFGFKLLWRFTEWAWRGIVIVKSFIPTEGGTPQELKDVTPKSGGKAPGGSHGPTHKPKPSEARTVTAGRRGPTKARKAAGVRHSFKGFGGFGAGSSGHAAKDKDPMSMLVFLLMIVVMISWLANASFSPWQANFGCPVKLPLLTPDPTCHTNVATGFSNAFTVLNNSGIFRVFVPLAIVMFIFYIYKEFTGEDLSETSGNIIRED